MTIKKNKAVLLIFLLFLNYLIVGFYKLDITLKSIFGIQLFLFSLSVFTTVIKKKFAKIKNSTPFHFLAINFFRICVCIIFLLPSILKYSKSDNIYIYNLFIIYFGYLFFEMNILPKNQNKIKG